jgi:hypothetical protein
MNAFAAEEADRYEAFDQLVVVTQELADTLGRDAVATACLCVGMMYVEALIADGQASRAGVRRRVLALLDKAAPPENA